VRRRPERRRCCGREGGRCGRAGLGDDAGPALADHPEHPGGQVVDLAERDLGRPEELVPLAAGVLVDHGGQFGAERLAVGRQPLEVALAEFDGEHVGGDGAVAVEHGGLVVEFALECCGDLDRLDLGAEGAGEGAVDQPVQPLLEPLQDAHATSLRARRVRTLAVPSHAMADRTPRGPGLLQDRSRKAPESCVLAFSTLARVAE
jgi:hypothetical protein